MIQLPPVSDEKRRLEMLHSLGLTGSSDASLHALAVMAAELAEVPIGLVTLIDSEHVRFVGATGFEAERIDRWDAFCGHVLLRPTEMLWVEDARADHRFHDNPHVVGEPKIRFYAGEPLRVNGCMVGTLCVLGQEPRAYDPVLSARLRRLAEVCAAELAERHRTNAVRHALTASADALIDCDADGLVQTWSAGAERLFGFSYAEAVGSEITLIIPPEHHRSHREGMRRWNANGAARLGRRLELPARRKDGAGLDIELWMSVSHDNGRPRIHANIRDISERRAQARELAAATARAEDANRAKTAFLANMSHELRTPLNGVTACSGMLSASVLAPDQIRMVEIIGGAADHLSRLIEDLLDLARIESGELNLDPRPVALGALVDDIVDLCRLKADEKGIGLRLQMLDDARQTVRLDAGRMKQVLANLLSNAIKFTESGEVVMTVARSGSSYRFEVRDTGIGFEPELQSVIFDRFQQADASITRRFGGTGLGLSICRDLVQAMNGNIECRSTPGQGSVFWVDLDLEIEAQSLPDSGPMSHPAEPMVDGLRILVVDDNPTNRQVAGMIVEAAGMEACHAASGREALAAMAGGAFDLILMDMMMPDMDGVEATRRLRAGEAGGDLRHTPVIMLTANTLPEHVAQSLAAGADSHLAKPITPTSLLRAIAETLTARHDAGSDALAIAV